MSLSVREAVSTGKVFCAFQPLVDVHDKSTYGYEALARCESPEFPSPPRLIKAAIDDGYLGELGRELRRMAITQCPDHRLFLNIHPNEFDEPWLVRPDDPTATHDRDIFLEITESVPLSHHRFCHSVLAEIRTKGVKIAVDDLGAGYSNLKYIADLSPEVVKLDRGLIAGLTNETRLHRLVTAIVRLCTDLGAKVVAEGIETAEELRAVIATGAHYAQGYFLARPNREPPAPDWSQLFRSL
ncbi:MAG: EAL domain-containing protein [Deltaproteobacteria bacterium]|nr:EAL domain-containing protein [Deltaproteobacteria bacterium]